VSRRATTEPRASRRVALWPALGALLVAGVAGSTVIGSAPGVTAAWAQAPPAARRLAGVALEVAPREHPALAPAPGWPLWLKDRETSRRTEETSAIAFAGRDAAGRACFVLADDIGQLHLCRVTEAGAAHAADSADPPPAPRLQLERVQFGASCFDTLAAQTRWDFEALALAPLQRGALLADTLTGLLAIEGREPDVLGESRVLRIRLARNAADATPGPASPAPWRVETDGDVIPGAVFWNDFVGADRGIQGLGLTDEHIYFGLSRLAPRGEPFARGSAIFVYDRVRDRVATLLTASLEIRSVTGLTAPDDTVLVVLDGDRMALNVLRWGAGAEGWTARCDRFPLELPGPDGLRFAIPTLAGVTLDDRGDIWCVLDPSPEHYRVVGPAPELAHVLVAARMPMLYRFPGAPVWEALEREHRWEEKR